METHTVRTVMVKPSVLKATALRVGQLDSPLTVTMENKGMIASNPATAELSCVDSLSWNVRQHVFSVCYFNASPCPLLVLFMLCSSSFSIVPTIFLNFFFINMRFLTIFCSKSRTYLWSDSHSFDTVASIIMLHCHSVPMLSHCCKFVCK